MAASAKQKTAGFTLIELLIAVTIMSLVIGLASYAFSLFSSHWQRPRNEFRLASGQLQRIDLVVNALTDALPWIVFSNRNTAGFYFLGREEGLTLVSGSPVFASAAPAVIRLFREPDGAGLWRLVYEEASLEGILLREADQVLPFDKRMVVVSGLPQINFEYFGWRSLEARALSVDTGEQPQWSTEFDGIVRVQQPQRVALQLNNFNWVIPMPERTDSLLGRLAGDL